MPPAPGCASRERVPGTHPKRASDHPKAHSWCYKTVDDLTAQPRTPDSPREKKRPRPPLAIEDAVASPARLPAIGAVPPEPLGQSPAPQPAAAETRHTPAQHSWHRAIPPGMPALMPPAVGRRPVSQHSGIIPAWRQPIGLGPPAQSKTRKRKQSQPEQEEVAAPITPPEALLTREMASGTGMAPVHGAASPDEHSDCGDQT